MAILRDLGQLFYILLGFRYRPYDYPMNPMFRFLMRTENSSDFQNPLASDQVPYLISIFYCMFISAYCDFVFAVNYCGCRKSSTTSYGPAWKILVSTLITPIGVSYITPM